MTILGIDYGEKRIGIAVSDPSETISFGLELLNRSSNIENDIAAIFDLVKKKEARMIVVGLPLNMSGTYGEKAFEVKAFCEILKKKLSVEVETFDERLSSVEAERVLMEANISGKKRRRVLDKIAAQIILQGYLDMKNVI